MSIRYCVDCGKAISLLRVKLAPNTIRCLSCEGEGDEIDYSGSSTAAEETQIDGSRGWHTFRDHGQFGSHPMFDSMDDESLP
ncbi:TraR/DksA C4-type zinc finger protein [Candidatus Contendibacter odensensis]|uniref:TraR/DksA C4-type zinc finger protein n=1 Tax=Candidatus Contendibacter odensensis TaxID=1400860 RepID=UPI003B969E53